MNIDIGEIIANELTNSNNWKQISLCNDLTDKFIIQFKNQLSWVILCERWLLSETVIRECQDVINNHKEHEYLWRLIAMNLELSNEFIEEFYLQLPLSIVLFRNSKDTSTELIHHLITKKAGII